MRKRIKNWIRRGAKKPIDIDPFPNVTKTMENGGWRSVFSKMKTKQGRKELRKTDFRKTWKNIETACMHGILLPLPRRKKKKQLGES